MIDKDIVNSFVRTDMESAKKAKSNDNFFTRNPKDIIPDIIIDLNLGFNNSILPEGSTKSFSA